MDVIKGTAFWKDITILILSAVIFPMIAWGANSLITNSKEIEVVKTQQIYNDKEFDKIHKKLDILLERTNK